MESRYLFVYGTLRCGSTHPLSKTLSEDADWLGKATIQGKLYRISWYPGLTLSTNTEDLVIGDLYQFDPASSLITQLDAFEGYNPSKPVHTQEYRREVHPVAVEGATDSILAWVYLYNPSVDQLAIIPSGDFLKA